MENQTYDSVWALSKNGVLYAQYGDKDCSGEVLCEVRSSHVIFQYSAEEGSQPSVIYLYETESSEFRVVSRGGQQHELQIGVWDLSAEGDRWEGGFYNGKPFGFGSYYEPNGHLVYRGCMINGVRSLYGIVLFGDTKAVEYAGMMLNGKKWGAGVLFNRHQSVVHNGDWMNDRPVSSYDLLTPIVSVTTLHTRLRKAILKLNRCTSLHLHDFSVLASLVFESGSCDLLATIQIDAMASLRSVVFGDHSCGSSTENASLTIQNCPCLETLLFKPSACCFFASFEITRCPLVSRLSFGGSNFVRAQRCSLRSMGYLRDLYIGEGSFVSVMDFELRELRQLRSVTMGWCAVRGLPEGEGGGILRLRCSFLHILLL